MFLSWSVGDEGFSSGSGERCMFILFIMGHNTLPLRHQHQHNEKKYLLRMKSPLLNTRNEISIRCDETLY